MKPRQTIKNYHNSNVPQYPHQNLSSATTLRDLELSKSGINLDEMSNPHGLNSTNISSQDEIVKCLQAIYGKNSAEILQKLPVQSVSPQDYQRVSGGIEGNINITGASGSGLISTSSNSHNPIQHHKQEVQYANSQQDLQHQTPAMNHFRLPTSNVHSPQQQLSQKSVLSLHQHHQNDLSNRRLNHHHLSTSNASFANLSAVSASNATPSNTSSDINSLGVLSSNIGKGLNSAPATHVPNVMDTLGSTDNMFYDSPLQITKEPPAIHQSLIRHQQLQKLLKANNNNQQLRTTSSPSTTLPNRSELQQRGNTASSNMSQAQYPLSSQPSTSSPLQAAFTTVPKSLLNLAACSSSPSTSSSSLPSASKFSTMVSQLNLRSARSNISNNQANLNSNNINSNATSARSFNRKLLDMAANNLNEADASNLRGPSIDQNNQSQHTTRSATSSTPKNNSASSSKNLKQIQWSLLSDDQSTTSTRSSNSKPSSSNVNQKAQSNTRKSTPALSPKDAFLANLQERAARAGVSIGEINKATSNPNISNKTFVNCGAAPSMQQNTISISPNQSKDYPNLADRKEIESALSRVEARNDLSLLYPPMLLAASSQKQINAFSAGIDCAEESDVFTTEVKRIILEECNIIYECKECNNLFRSLANLVRHKREFCTEHVAERNSMEIHKRSQMSTILPGDQQAIESNSTVTFVGENQQINVDDQDQALVGPDSRMEDSQLSGLNNSQKINERSISVGNGEKMIQFLKDLEARKMLHEREGPKTRSSRGANFCSQTNLSKILQSQPKYRLPSAKDTNFIGALNMNPTSTTEVHSNNPISAFESDKNSNYSSSDVHEQLARNSSLAKTLLNEQVKGNNSRQSLIELSKVLSAESSVPRTTKRIAPKRKFLEDCIQKVKRDKLLPEEEDLGSEVSAQPNVSHEKSTSSQRSNQNLTSIGSETSDKVEEAPKFNSSNDSDLDSDTLMIDLDEPKKVSPLRRGQRRGSNAASSTASSSSSTKTNSTSALLKALTRPVDTKKTSDSNSLPSLDELPPDAPAENITDQKPKELSEYEEEVDKEVNRVPSPLFNTYTCDICDINHDDLASLMEHTGAKHRTEKIVYPCIFCSLSFIALENVCRHIVDIHKKPKAQVHRLKDVVRSRSHITTDFLGCVDHPPSSTAERELETTDKAGTGDADEVIDVVKDELSKSPSNQESISDESPSQVKVTCDSVEGESEDEEAHDIDSISESGSSADLENDVEIDEVENDEVEQDEVERDEVENDEVDNDEMENDEIENDEVENDELENEDVDDDSSSSSDNKSAEADKCPSSPPEPNPSSSNTSGSGGIMKLKIQLKTRPDEKSKVYEIV